MPLSTQALPTAYKLVSLFVEFQKCIPRFSIVCQQNRFIDSLGHGRPEGACHSTAAAESQWAGVQRPSSEANLLGEPRKEIANYVV